MGDTGRILGAVGAGVAGFSQARRNRGDRASFVAMAANRFQQIGSDEATQFSQQLQANPRAALEYAKQFGGFDQLFAGMEERAKSGQLADLVQHAIGGGGGAGPPGSDGQGAQGQPGAAASPDDVIDLNDVNQFLVDGLRAGFAPGQVYSMAQILALSVQGGEGGPPKWWLSAAKTLRPDAESMKKAIEFGNSTGDWNGAYQQLEGRPEKGPQWTPGKEMSARKLALFNQFTRDGYLTPEESDEAALLGLTLPSWGARKLPTAPPGAGSQAPAGSEAAPSAAEEPADEDSLFGRIFQRLEGYGRERMRE
jgi:hypothetical protein